VKQISFIFVILLLASCMMFSANSPPQLSNNTADNQITAIVDQNLQSEFLAGEIMVVPAMLWFQGSQSELQATAATARNWLNSDQIFMSNNYYNTGNTTRAENLLKEKKTEVGTSSPQIVRLWTKVMV